MLFGPRPVIQNRFFEMFNGGGGTPTNNATQPQNQNQNKTVPESQQTQDYSQDTMSGAQPDKNKDDANKSPLAEFAGLWEPNATPKEGEPVQPDYDDFNSIVPELNIDPKKLIESAKKIDFSKVVNPERAAAALKGDVGAFTEILNSVAQASFANSAMAMGRMSKAVMAQMAEKLYTGALPHHFRKHQINAQIDADNPIFQDPAVAPMLEMAKNQMRVKYPKASAAEISSMAKKYVMTFAETVTGGGKPNPNGKGGKNSTAGGGEDEMDWMEFANSTPTPKQ